MFNGSHVSIAGGFDKCLDRIIERGGNCLMTFASSPRSLQTKEFTEADVEVYIEKKKTSKVGPHFFHGVYLVNLGSDKPDYLRASIDSLVFYQTLAGRIGGEGTIFHLGSTKQEFSEIKDQVVIALNRVLAATPKDVKLFLENAAGQAGSIGDRFEDLHELIKNLEEDNADKIGVCLDTQHCFAQGYALETVLDEFDRVIGLPYLSVVHMNDSKTDFGSKVDRHENLGDGKIGKKVLKQLATDPRLENIPFILEVPGHGDGPRKEDIDILKQLRKQ